MDNLPRLLNVRKAQNKRRLGNKYGLLWKLLWHLGNITHQIQCCLKYLWQTGILYGAYYRNLGDSQGRPLIFYFKIMLSCASNYCPFFWKTVFGLPQRLRMNVWPWATMLSCNLGSPLWIKYCWTNKAYDWSILQHFIMKRKKCT